MDQWLPGAQKQVGIGQSGCGMKDSYGDGNILYLDCITVNILVVILQIVLQDIITVRNQAKGLWNFFVLLFKTTCEPVFISK